MKKKTVLIEQVERRILLVRGHRVMLDSDLAELYGVTTFNLNKAVNRNLDRFPEDFCFRISKKEYQALIFRFGISRPGHGGRRFLPYVFTEQGVAMLSSVLRSKRAVRVNIAIMRAFVKLRVIASSHRELTRKLSEMERWAIRHDADIGSLFRAIDELKSRPDMPPPAIPHKAGFKK